MRIGFDAKRAFHNFRGLGNYSRDLIRILQERTDTELVLFNPKRRKFLGVKITPRTTEINPKGFFGKNSKVFGGFFILQPLPKNSNLISITGFLGRFL